MNDVVVCPARCGRDQAGGALFLLAGPARPVGRSVELWRQYYRSYANYCAVWRGSTWDRVGGRHSGGGFDDDGGTGEEDGERCGDVGQPSGLVGTAGSAVSCHGGNECAGGRAVGDNVGPDGSVLAGGGDGSGSMAGGQVGVDGGLVCDTDAGNEVGNLGVRVVVEPGKHAVSNRRKKEKKRNKKFAAVDGNSQGPAVSEVGVAVESVVGCQRAAVGASGDSGVSFRDVTTVEEQRVFARQWYERKKVENDLAIQRAAYNVKRNAYLDRARISEKRWEQERLTCEQKLANITEARFGSKPGYAETLASVSDGSERPPSLSTGSDSPANLSDGTVSPNSSMSVAEENRLKKKIEELSGKVKEMELRETAFRAGLSFSKGHAEIEDGRIHVFDGSGQYVPPTPDCPSEFCAGSMGDYPEELQYYHSDC